MLALSITQCRAIVRTCRLAQVLGQIINNHVYPTDQGQYFYTVPGTKPGLSGNTSAIAACQPNDPTAGNAFNIQTHFDNVVTFISQITGYGTTPWRRLSREP